MGMEHISGRFPEDDDDQTLANSIHNTTSIAACWVAGLNDLTTSILCTPPLSCMEAPQSGFLLSSYHDAIPERSQPPGDNNGLAVPSGYETCMDMAQKAWDVRRKQVSFACYPSYS
jgi:hypothetical protein